MAPLVAPTAIGFWVLETARLPKPKPFCLVDFLADLPLCRCLLATRKRQVLIV